MIRNTGVVRCNVFVMVCCHVVWCSKDTLSCCMVSCCMLFCCLVSCYLVSFFMVSCSMMSCHMVSCCMVSCFMVSCSMMSCSMMSCCMLCGKWYKLLTIEVDQLVERNYPTFSLSLDSRWCVAINKESQNICMNEPWENISLFLS